MFGSSLVRMRSPVRIRPSALTLEDVESNGFRGFPFLELFQEKCLPGKFCQFFERVFTLEPLTNINPGVPTFANRKKKRPSRTYIFPQTFSSISVRYFTYLRSVVSVLLCPSSLAITSKAMPFSRHSVAHVSRKS